MQITIRNAKKADMSKVRELIVELAVFEKEPDAVDVTVADLEKAGFEAEPLFRCFVAEVDTKIVGMALVYFRFSTWKGRVLHLEDLIVTNAMRGKGVGEKLYAAVLEYGHSLGCKRVQWEVLGWNEGAIKFYERSGANVLRDWHVVHMDEQGLTNFLNT
ncbi:MULTISPECIES: GNAT family N-acetyltransferase [Altibacter]|uniref:GNAT family N-acetyltransferase n=1 Tax=Altibacter TaxID=1535231 RepID=UPI000554CF7B|nr:MULTISPECIES: GNAT family N-acetyltransferase [Altibacter]MCW8981500.1 GNAT family N-acetyltransferase [Altibacter sp.]MCW9037401.1 GNAT family N-acetyltransferase [Altibacter sp.]